MKKPARATKAVARNQALANGNGSHPKRRPFTAIGWAVLGISGITIALCVAAAARNPVTPALQRASNTEVAATGQNQIRNRPVQHRAVSEEQMPPKAKQATTRAEAKQIIAQGSGTNSAFTYDPFGRLVKIIEPDSTVRQFMYNGDTLCEERDGSGNVTKQFFDWGETIGGTKYFYNRDQLGSVREMTDSSGNIVAQYTYDAWGRATKLQGSGPDSDFLYAGYFYHKPSGLYITAHRVYSPKLGRWLSRDPIDEPGFAMSPHTPEPGEPSIALQPMPTPPDPNMLALQSVSRDPLVLAQLATTMQSPSAVSNRTLQTNPYTYVANNPISNRDPSGLMMTPPKPGPAVCPLDNDLYNKCVENCRRTYAGEPRIIAWCIWNYCRKYNPR
jgi:RHS repeat-associated protein